MAIVYVIGAGASYGESLLPANGEHPLERTPTPPLSTGFFDGTFWHAVGYTPREIEEDFPEAFRYVRQWMPSLPEEAGTGAWSTINIEDILTSIELEREFRGTDSDDAGFLLLAQNKLVRLTWRLLAMCTERRYGQWTRRLVHSLDLADSVITFNWDLLLDQEFSPFGGHPDARWHYQNFFAIVLQQNIMGGRQYVIAGPGGPHKVGLFLKLHGSLNWLCCTNQKCPSHSEIWMQDDIQLCLQSAMGIGRVDETCVRCGSAMFPLLVPPLLRKPIADNWIIKSMWGLARQRLADADTVVLVGFSAAPTDFYASWLLHSTIGTKPGGQVIIVNPQTEAHTQGHEDFERRMQAIFPVGIKARFVSFSQIDEILALVYPA